MCFEYPFELRVGDVVRLGPVLILKFILECQAIDADVLLELLHHVFVLLGGLDASHLVGQGVFLHVVGGVECVTHVDGQSWVLLQNFGECNVIYEFILVELVRVWLVGLLFKDGVYFLFGQLGHVDFQKRLCFLLVAYLFSQFIEVIELLSEVDTISANFSLNLGHDLSDRVDNLHSFSCSDSLSYDILLLFLFKHHYFEVTQVLAHLGLLQMVAIRVRIPQFFDHVLA